MSENPEGAFDVLTKGDEAALSTLEDGKPFVSAVSYLYEPGRGRFGSVVILISDLARHTRNIQKNSSVSLLVMEGNRPLYERRRVTAQGKARLLKDETRIGDYAKRYRENFPDSEMLLGFSDFHFFEVDIEGLHFIAGFGRVQSFGEEDKK